MSTEPAISSAYLRSFHRHFQFDVLHWSTNLVLESAQGVRFHFPSQPLISASTIFAHAALLSCNEEDRLKPIPLTFAPTIGLHCFLWMLRPHFDDQCRRLSGRLRAPLDCAISALRIAHILDVSAMGKTLMEYTDLDAYLLSAIEDAAEGPMPRAEYLLALLAGYPTNDTIRDGLFGLRTAFDFAWDPTPIREFDPSVSEAVFQFNAVQQYEIAVLHRWLSSGAHPVPTLRDDWNYPYIQHGKICPCHPKDFKDFARRLSLIAPQAMDALANSHSRFERSRRIRNLISKTSERCSGCAVQYEAVYNPAIQNFDQRFWASFP